MTNPLSDSEKTTVGQLGKTGQLLSTYQTIANQVVCSHQYGEVTTYDAMAIYVRSLAEREASQNAATRSSVEPLNSAFALLRTTLDSADSEAGKIALSNTIRYVADQQVRKNFNTNEQKYAEATNSNQVVIDETTLNQFAQELKSLSSIDGPAILRGFMDDTSAQFLLQCPNRAFLWTLIRDACPIFPICINYTKRAALRQRNQFLKDCISQFGRAIPLYELWLLSQLEDIEQKDSLSTLSQIELAFCLQRGALCLKNQPLAIDFNPLFVIPSVK